MLNILLNTVLYPIINPDYIPEISQIVVWVFSRSEKLWRKMEMNQVVLRALNSLKENLYIYKLSRGKESFVLFFKVNF